MDTSNATESYAALTEREKSWVEGRAESLCNFWGDDPNDDALWNEALTHAIGEIRDGVAEGLQVSWDAATDSFVPIAEPTI